MYEKYFKLKQKPFELVPDPRFLFMSSTHRRALNYLQYGFDSGDVEDLLALLTDTSFHEAPEESKKVWVPLHAWRTLGQLGNLRAIKPMIGMFNSLCEDDWALVELPRAVAMIGRDSISPLTNFMRDSSNEEFARHGIAGDRLELRHELMPGESYLSVYGSIDIALDPFPWNGHVTTCEALWMGIPVVTLAGEQHAGRVGVSLMNMLGLPQLIAADREDYCRLAVALAFDIDQRQQWRTSLRTKMGGSSLCNGAEFAGNVELAYRGMWEKWCAAAPGN